jgi:xanthine dehydrogenase accessory factor
MISIFAQLCEAIEQEGSAALVSLTDTDGSSPRAAGARMVVRPSGGFNGSIGGGALEWQALARAKATLERGRGPVVSVRQALGPELGQCCGGRVAMMIETFDRRDLGELRDLAEASADHALQTRARLTAEGRLSRQIVAAGVYHAAIVRQPDGTIMENFGDELSLLLLFGAGHVGKALMLALAPLPFLVRWIDPRPAIFPRLVPSNVVKIESRNCEAEIEGAAANALVLVMTHSHALDFDIVKKALSLDRFAYVGLIGSMSKRARFVKRLAAFGLSDGQLSGLTCPIGIEGIVGKEPATIAAAVTAQLLIVRERQLAELGRETRAPDAPVKSVRPRGLL